MKKQLRTVADVALAIGARTAPHPNVQVSNDPKFAEKLKDVVGLYVDPPGHAVVLSVDEKSQIQALDRTQPGLPMKPGRAGTMTHDCKRNGTTTLFAALNVLDGTIIGRNMRRHRHPKTTLNHRDEEFLLGASDPDCVGHALHWEPSFGSCHDGSCNVGFFARATRRSDRSRTTYRMISHN